VLAEGARCVDEAVTILHHKTYQSLRARCRRYFADLVPGKQIDLLPVTMPTDTQIRDSSGGGGGGGARAGGSSNQRAITTKGAKLDDGLRFVLISSSSSSSSSFADNEDETDDDNIENHPSCSTNIATRSTDELSGGQLALLGLSFVFAAALYKRSPLYLLDEVDAALDESNQRTVGAVIARIFGEINSETAPPTGKSKNRTTLPAARASQVICVSHHSSLQQQASATIQVEMHDGVSKIIG
jgi:ABC-type dipeptide/oligopeptide/nickel transport system ATPase subunit